MKKVLISLLVGGFIAGAVLAGPLSPTSASGQKEEPVYQSESSGTGQLDMGSLIGALDRAGAEIEDEDIARFYTLLVEEYGLDGSAVIDSSGNPVADALPDIDHIVRTAVCLPLQEAGKNIRDKDIAEFYRDFLEDTGLTMEQQQ
jgi:hypothetical protein